MTNFTPPTAFHHIHWNELHGRLLAIEPLAEDKKVVTGTGAHRTATVAKVTVIDGPDSGHVLPVTYIFPGAIRAAVKSHVGETLLGRVSQGTPPMEGQAPPWLFVDATDNEDDVTLAALVLSKHTN